MLVVLVITALAASSAFINFLFANVFISVTGLLVFSVVIVSSILCWLKGYSPARNLVVAWCFFVAGGVLFVFMMMGVLKLTLLTEFGFYVGFCVSAILFSISLGDRLNALLKQYLSEATKRRRAERTVRESEEKYRQHCAL